MFDFDTLDKLIAYYAALRKRFGTKGVPRLVNHPAGLTGIYNPETRQWDWYRLDSNIDKYVKTGSTCKRNWW